MLIGVVSDTHNNLKNINKIIYLFNKYSVDLVAHTGDISNAKALDKFSDLNCDLIGVFGGYLTGSVLLNVDAGVYWNHVFESVTWTDVRGGYLKAIVFGALTISICAYRGFFTHLKSSLHGVRGVTESATRAVVFSSVAVLAADYLITSFLI